MLNQSQINKLVREVLLDQSKSLDPDQYCWEKQARPSQRLPQGNWYAWLILAGRGFGKTRTGAETIRSWVLSGQAKRIALIGATEDEVRQIMIEGESGLLSVHAPEERPYYMPSRKLLVWPNGACARIFSGAKPDQLRGPQFDGAWIDELAKFPEPEALWQQLNFSLRLGKSPKVVITTTPRPLKLLKTLLEREGQDVVLTRGSSFENKENLSPTFLKMMETTYAGTRLGAQELYGEILESVEGALWCYDQMEEARIQSAPELARIVVAVDPAVTAGEESDETGLVVAGLSEDGKYYVLEDGSGRYPPLKWAKLAVELYKKHKADRIIAEVNQGGDLVQTMIRSLGVDISFQSVRATRGKFTRAEPVAALYEQGLVHHVGRAGFPELEEQLCSYVPGKSISPDRLDALVWAITALQEMCASLPNRGAWR